MYYKMANRLILAILLVVGLLCLGNVAYLDYAHFKDKSEPVLGGTTATADSILVDDLEFTSVDEVMKDRKDFEKNIVVDSVYLTIPEATLHDIASVLIGKNGSTTVPDIVTEYLRHYQDIYQYLKPAENPPATPAEQNTRDTTTVTADTVIGGQPYKRL